MIYNVSKYRDVIKPQVKNWCDFRGGDPVKQIPEISLATGCPLLVVGALVEELYGPDAALTVYMDRLKVFYKAKVEE